MGTPKIHLLLKILSYSESSWKTRSPDSAVENYDSSICYKNKAMTTQNKLDSFTSTIVMQ